MTYYSALHYAAKAEKSAIRAEEAAASATSEIEITDLGIVEGTVSLETNKVYKAMTASPSLTFDLNNVDVIMGVVNQIKVYLQVDSDVVIDWGTTTFYNGITPDIVSGGKYEVYFEYNPYTFTWTAGVLSAEVA